MNPDILDHYNLGLEAQRLLRGTGRLELARTQELVRRYLPPAPAVVYDVGGGSGIYATWLAIESPGWAVHDLDAAWDDPARRERILSAVRAMEAEPTLLGASAHLLAVGLKRDDGSPPAVWVPVPAPEA